MVGEDVPLNKIFLTNALTLVGRFGGRKISSEGINSWVSNSWQHAVSLYPKIFILPRGCLAFKFQNTKYLDAIMKGVWKWDNLGLFLKRWMPLFDPRIERYDSIPIWVKLPNFPFEFWSVDFFRMIGNALGTFLEANSVFLRNWYLLSGESVGPLRFK